MMMNQLILLLMLLVIGITAPFLVQPISIPRIIHYVWVGKNPLPMSAQIAIDSWKQYAPGYRIVKWDETNCPIESSPFARRAYQDKKWAFVSDYCRFYALKKYGGLYLDTDQYLIRDIRPILKNNMKLIVSWEDYSWLSASIIAGSKAHPVFSEIVHLYEKEENLPTSPHLLTQTLTKHIRIPHPGYSYRIKNDVLFYSPNITMINLGGPETVSVHGYNGSWLSNAQPGKYIPIIYRSFMQNIALRITSNKTTDYLIPYRHPFVYRLSDQKQGKILQQSSDSVTVKYNDGLIRTYHLKR